MDKLHMQTADGAADNLQRLAALFPSCVTETLVDGVPTKAIDFDALRTLLGADAVVDDESERYQFTWPGKRRASQLAGMPIRATLRPCPEESEDFEHTRNLYIEGDNLDVLKCLRETYLGRVKMIYIDPPYNTGGDFVYHDHYAKTKADYLAESGQFDDQGQHLETNPESNGRFHTDWLNMIYPRLRVARDLLSDDGVIFISIDDHEVENLKKVCNEVFGEGNFYTCFVIIRSEGGGLAKRAVIGHDYMIAYAKDIRKVRPLGRPKDIRGKIVNKDGEDYWIETDWFREEFGKYGTCHYEDILYYYNNKKKEEIDNGIKKGYYVLLPRDGKHIVGRYRKISDDTSKFYTIQKFLNKDGVNNLSDLHLDQFFSFPKPVSLIREFIMGSTILSKNCDNIILDFFSGSATTAHAVMQLNAEDGGNRRFIMVQIPEACAADSEAYKAGYSTICEIGKERIRRAGKKIRQELAARREKEGPLFAGQDTTELDTGFRVLKLDSTNMEDVFYTPREVEQASLFQQEQNVKPDRTPLDLLFQVMLELGIPLDAHIEPATLLDTTIYRVDNCLLVACLEPHVSEAVVEAIAKMQPEYAVVREPQDDATLTNFDELFKTYSPDTQRKTL